MMSNHDPVSIVRISRKSLEGLNKFQVECQAMRYIDNFRISRMSVV